MTTKYPLNKFQELQTPFYYYDIEVLNEVLDSARKAVNNYGFHLHYAIKANANDKILRSMILRDFGADCVSGNEVQKALDLGFSPKKIAFAGVGKSDKEIEIGLNNDIFSFNVESIQEIKVINDIAVKLDKQANIALRINPNVDAKTHKYITTGIEENKFGINFWELEDVIQLTKTLPNVRLKGLHFHIGSQITDMAVFKGLCIRVNEIQRWFWDHRIIPDHVNLGGGLGINYLKPNLLPDFEEFFSIFNDNLEIRTKQTVHFELGRALVAHCGTLVSRVLFIKNGIKTNFAILDAGMTELIRPALYQSIHKIENLSSDKELRKYDVVGPICESSDCFGKAVDLNETNRGDIIVIKATGAYGEVMSSQYNLRSKTKAYYSDEL